MKIIWIFAFFLYGIHAAYAENIDFSTRKLQKIERRYCELTAEQKASYIKNTDRYAFVLPIVKKPYDYNKLSEREKKKEVEGKNFYDAEDYPEQEQNFKLGFIFSGIECEILNRAKAFEYLSKAGRKPESYLIIAKIYYNENNLERSLYYLEKSAKLGLEKAFTLGFALSRSKREYQHVYNKFKKLYDEYQINTKKKRISIDPL